MTIIKKKALLSFLALLAGLIIYYFLPIDKIPDGTIIDKIVVLKSQHKLIAYAQHQVIVTYKVAIGRNPTGNKEYEGDGKTPEGIYTINDKNPNSGWHKNPGVSYPNLQDILNAQRSGKAVGGNIKIHGLKNGQDYLGKFQHWKDWTNGCIALSNQELDELYDHTMIGTPIEIKK